MQCFICETDLPEDSHPAEVWADGARLIVICPLCAQPPTPDLPDALRIAMLTARDPVAQRAVDSRIRSFRLIARCSGIRVKSRCITDRTRELVQLSRGVRSQIQEARRTAQRAREQFESMRPIAHPVVCGGGRTR